MQFEPDKSLKAFNTFGFDVSAEYFVTVRSVDEITEAINWARQKSLAVFALGGGSNLVLAKNIGGLVMNIETRGVDVIAESTDTATLRVQAGENWHTLVNRCIQDQHFGLENLSLIPGKVGTAPIQNIGAYGVELRDCFTSLNAIDINSGNTANFSRDDCRFAYRDSIFKRELKQTHVITDITLTLSKTFLPQLEYGDIRRKLYQSDRDPENARHVADVICETRREKLPDPETLGNAGSFFTNPMVTRQTFNALKARFPALVGFEVDAASCKIAAGWLVEHCGWKGHRRDNIGVHEQQALVLVNRGGGDGTSLLTLANDIRQSVFETFGLQLEIEPLVIR